MDNTAVTPSLGYDADGGLNAVTPSLGYDAGGGLNAVHVSDNHSGLSKTAGSMWGQSRTTTRVYQRQRSQCGVRGWLWVLPGHAQCPCAGVVPSVARGGPPWAAVSGRVRAGQALWWRGGGAAPGCGSVPLCVLSVAVVRRAVDFQPVTSLGALQSFAVSLPGPALLKPGLFSGKSAAPDIQHTPNKSTCCGIGFMKIR